jgi:hypothetical protein
MLACNVEHGLAQINTDDHSRRANATSKMPSDNAGPTAEIKHTRSCLRIERRDNGRVQLLLIGSVTACF